MSETVTGYIDHVIFRNEDNGYTVMVLKGTKKEETPVIQNQAAATTLGDIDALAALKAQMEKGE